MTKNGVSSLSIPFVLGGNVGGTIPQATAVFSIHILYSLPLPEME